MFATARQQNKSRNMLVLLLLPFQVPIILLSGIRIPGFLFGHTQKNNQNKFQLIQVINFASPASGSGTG